MKSQQHGTSASEIEVTNISPHGFWLWLAGRELLRVARAFAATCVLVTKGERLGRCTLSRERCETRNDTRIAHIRHAIYTSDIAVTIHNDFSPPRVENRASRLAFPCKSEAPRDTHAFSQRASLRCF
jgi:hypothetical protein